MAWVALGVGRGSREAGPPLFTIYAPPPRAFRTLGSGGQATLVFQGGGHEWVEGGIMKFRVTGVIFLNSVRIENFKLANISELHGTVNSQAAVARSDKRQSRALPSSPPSLRSLPL